VCYFGVRHGFCCSVFRNLKGQSQEFFLGILDSYESPEARAAGIFKRMDINSGTAQSRSREKFSTFLNTKTETYEGLLKIFIQRWLIKKGHERTEFNTSQLLLIFLYSSQTDEQIQATNNTWVSNIYAVEAETTTTASHIHTFSQPLGSLHWLYTIQ
jgi:hypothetical protein